MGGRPLLRGRQHCFSAVVSAPANPFLQTFRDIHWSRYRLSRGPIVVGVALVAAGPRPPWTMATLTLGQIRQQDVGGFCAVRRSRVTALATERAVHFVTEAGPFKPPRLERRLGYFGQCIVRDLQNVAEATLFPEHDL